MPQVLYIYDLHRNPPSAAAAGLALPFAVSWQQQVADPADAAGGSVLAAAAAGAPQFSVARFITGTGQLHGGMTLQLTAVPQPPEQLAGGGNISVCILQVVPWYVRLWLHTLRLSVDGQVRRSSLPAGGFVGCRLSNVACCRLVAHGSQSLHCT